MLGFQMLIILVLCTFVSGDYKSGHLAACTKDPPLFQNTLQLHTLEFYPLHTRLWLLEYSKPVRVIILFLFSAFCPLSTPISVYLLVYKQILTPFNVFNICCYKVF